MQGRHYPFSEQVEHFRAAVRQMGPNAGAPERLGRCIFYVGMGSNDYLNNYFMPNYYTTAQSYDPAAYAADLLQEYSRQLAALHALGARKFVLAAVGDIGCIPYELARISNNQDDDDAAPSSDSGTGISISLGGVGLTVGGGGGGGRTAAADAGRGAIYYRGLLSMVKRLDGGGGGGRMAGATVVYLDTVRTGRAVAASAAAHGFEVLDRGCCGVGRNNGQITCLPMQQPCGDRSKYVFWDAFHPTEAANRIYAARAFNSSAAAGDAYPINVSQLAAI